MTHKAAVVFFLSLMEGRLLTPVPRTLMATHFGVHLMLLTLDIGLTAVRRRRGKDLRSFKMTKGFFAGARRKGTRKRHLFFISLKPRDLKLYIKGRFVQDRFAF